MSNSEPDEASADLPPPGRRWGAGAQSVLPYLTKTLQARPAGAPEPREYRAPRPHAVFTNWPPSRPT